MEGTERGYVSLDDLTERALAKNDPELFLQLHKPPMLIDEVQYAPELFPYIKILADREHTPGAFWLTGSQIFRIMRGVSESLAGCAAVLSMTSLSQAEICGAQTEPFGVDLESLLDKSSAPRGKGAVIYMKPQLTAIDRDNYVVPVWTI